MNRWTTIKDEFQAHISTLSQKKHLLKQKKQDKNDTSLSFESEYASSTNADYDDQNYNEHEKDIDYDEDDGVIMQAVKKRKKVKASTNFVKQADAHDISMTKWTESSLRNHSRSSSKMPSRAQDSRCSHLETESKALLTSQKVICRGHLSQPLLSD